MSFMFRCIMVFFLMLAPLMASADDKSDSDNGLSSIKTGRLARYGVTAGAALGGMLPVSKTVHGAGSGQILYVEALPFLWGWKADISRAYCVAKYTAGNAQVVADQVALERSGLKAKSSGSAHSLDDEDIAVVLGVSTSAPQIGLFKAQTLSAQRSAIEQFVFAHSQWKLGVPGAGCWRTWVGFYVGRPSSFNMNVDFTPKDMMGAYQAMPERRVGELKPLASVGVTLGPVSEVRLLLGATLSNVVLKADGPGTQVWTWTVALGGNLDIIGALFPK